MSEKEPHIVKVGDIVIYIPRVNKIAKNIKPQPVKILEISPNCMKKVKSIDWEMFRDKKNGWRAVVRNWKDDKEEGYWVWGYELLPTNWREKYEGIVSFPI